MWCVLQHNCWWCGIMMAAPNSLSIVLMFKPCSRITQLTKCVCHLYICHPSHQICMSIDVHIPSSCQHAPSHLCMIHCNFMIWLGVCWEVDCAGCDHACFNSNSHALLVTTTNLLSSIIHTHFMYHDLFGHLWCCHFDTHVQPQHCSQDDNTKTYPNHSSISSPFLQTWAFVRKHTENQLLCTFA